MVYFQDSLLKQMLSFILFQAPLMHPRDMDVLPQDATGLVTLGGLAMELTTRQ